MSRTPRPRTLAIALLPAVAALGLAACGGGDDPSAKGSSAGSASSSSSTTTEAPPTPSELFAAAKKTALASKSVHITGTMTEDGDTTTIDLAGLTDGSNQTLELGIAKDAKVTMLTVDGKYYMLGDAGFWSGIGGAALGKQLGGKYVLMNQSQAKEFGDMTIKSLLEDMFSDKDFAKLGEQTGKVTKTTVNGVDAWSVTDSGDKTKGELLVTADDKATIIKIVGPKDDPGEIEFSEWNQVNPVKAPAKSQVVEMPK